MVLFDAVLVLGLVGLLLYGTFRLLSPAAEPLPPPPVSSAGVWRTAHYDDRAATLVVLQKVSVTDGTVLDEHVIASIPVADPEYDARFLAAMSLARERRALFELEEE